MVRAGGRHFTIAGGAERNLRRKGCEIVRNLRDQGGLAGRDRLRDLRDRMGCKGLERAFCLAPVALN